MAYENVRLVDEGKKIVEVDGHKKELNRITIDYETGNFMFEYYVNRNAPSHVRFEMFIRGIVVDLWFYKHFEDNPYYMIWTLERFFINGEIDKKEVFKEVKKAVEAYGCFGYTKKMCDDIKEKYNDMYPNGFAKLDLGRFR